MGDQVEKLARLRALLDRHAADSLALTSPESLAWLLDGARVTVPIGGAPVLSAIVRRDGVELAVFENELERMLEEELPAGSGFELRRVPWFEALPGGSPDDDAAQLLEPTVAAELRAARAPLLPDELERYRALGREVATATTSVLAAARPEWTERALAARLAEAVVGIGAEPLVLLVAGTARLELRHPLPGGGVLGPRAMAVVGARRSGLVANLTRWLGEEPGADGPARRLLEVEADAFAATRPGRALSEVLAELASAYGRHGFATDEWRRHHQGGPTGYAGRDPRATPSASDRVVAGQAFAWNPTASRQKVEDTVVIGAQGVEVLTWDAGWPGLEVRGLRRPLALPYG